MGCQRSDTYLVGADDLASLIRKNKDELIRKIRREKAAARVIQQGYRRSLYMRHGRAHRLALQLHDRMTHKLAAIIASLYRMRLAQRRLRVERDLVDVKVRRTWHLQGRGGGTHVWAVTVLIIPARVGETPVPVSRIICDRTFPWSVEYNG